MTSERAWNEWIETVARLVDGAPGVGSAAEIMLSDAARQAFEDGISADEYSLHLQAIGADRCADTIFPLLDGPLLRTPGTPR